MKDYYRILQVTPNASQEEIKKAYRKLAKVYHPDVAPNGIEGVFIHDINEAYRTLSHPEKRIRYNWMLKNSSDEKVVQEIPTTTYRSRPFNKIQTQIREWVQPYLVYTHTVSRIALVFCLLLGADFMLPLKQLRDKAVYLTSVESTNTDKQAKDHTQIKTWSGRKVQVSQEAGIRFEENPHMLLYITPVFSKARYVSSVRHVKHRFQIGRSIYGNYIFLPIILLITATLGSRFKRISPVSDFSFGVVSAVLLLICIVLLLV